MIVASDDFEKLSKSVKRLEDQMGLCIQTLETLDRIISIQSNIADVCMTAPEAATFLGLKIAQIMRSDCPRHIFKDPLTGKGTVQFLKSELIEFIKQS